MAKIKLLVYIAVLVLHLAFGEDDSAVSVENHLKLTCVPYS